MLVLMEPIRLCVIINKEFFTVTQNRKETFTHIYHKTQV